MHKSTLTVIKSHKMTREVSQKLGRVEVSKTAQVSQLNDSNFIGFHPKHLNFGYVIFQIIQLVTQKFQLLKIFMRGFIVFFSISSKITSQNLICKYF